MEREFTATIYIIKDDKVLLILHRKFKKWMAPGGHMDSNETPAETAIREAKEETGLDIEIISQENLLINRPNANSMPRPYLCLLEEIPAYGQRPAHQHMDLIFIGEPFGGVIKENLEETQGVRWWSLEEIENLQSDIDIFEDTLQIVRHILQKKPSKKPFVNV